MGSTVSILAIAIVSCEGQRSAIGRADRIRVDKQSRQLRLYSGDQLLRTYPVALGGDPVGPKQAEGDERTPEGRYSIAARNLESAFHRSLLISYPNELDRKRALAAGNDPGGLIMIHGIRNGLGWIGSLHRLIDWTDGCIAVTDPEMDEIWDAVEVGTPIEIRP